MIRIVVTSPILMFITASLCLLTVQVKTAPDIDISPDHTGILRVTPVCKKGENNSSRVIINEIMYAPGSGEPEWFELQAIGSDAVDLGGWSISDANTEKRYYMPAPNVVQPGDYPIITRNAAAFRLVHPECDRVIELPTMPASLLNNSGDQLVISDHTGVTVDSIAFSPSLGGSDGSSLERRLATGSSIDPENWVSCGDLSGSTPGRINEASPRLRDIRLEQPTISRWNGTEYTISASVRNAGLAPLEHVAVLLYHDTNRDSNASHDELIATEEISGLLPPGDTHRVAFVWTGSSHGWHQAIMEATTDGEERPADNVTVFALHIPFAEHALVLNEIMYDPPAWGSEYIELRNMTGSVVDVSGWRLRTSPDSSALKGNITIGKNIRLGAGELCVVAADSLLFRQFPGALADSGIIEIRGSGLSLANEGDIVVLLDPGGAVVDSLRYEPLWHTPDIEQRDGRALERIHPGLPSTDRKNWGTSAAGSGGTPGHDNSLMTVAEEREEGIVAVPNPFSPDGDGHEDVTVLSFHIPFRASAIRIRIFDSSGRVVRHLAEGDPSGSRGMVVWNGFDDRGERVRMGIYVVLIEARGMIASEFHELKGFVVAGYKM